MDRRFDYIVKFIWKQNTFNVISAYALLVWLKERLNLGYIVRRKDLY